MGSLFKIVFTCTIFCCLRQWHYSSMNSWYWNKYYLNLTEIKFPNYFAFKLISKINFRKNVFLKDFIIHFVVIHLVLKNAITYANGMNGLVFCATEMHCIGLIGPWSPLFSSADLLRNRLFKKRLSGQPIKS